MIKKKSISVFIYNFFIFLFANCKEISETGLSKPVW